MKIINMSLTSLFHIWITIYAFFAIWIHLNVPYVRITVIKFILYSEYEKTVNINYKEGKIEDQLNKLKNSALPHCSDHRSDDH